DRDEPAAELVAIADPDQPCVVFRTGVTEFQQLLQHHGDLHAVWRALRIELQRMAADWQLLVMRWTGDRTVDIGEAALSRPVPGPDLRRQIFGRTVHRRGSGCLRRLSAP